MDLGIDAEAVRSVIRSLPVDVKVRKGLRIQESVDEDRKRGYFALSVGEDEPSSGCTITARRMRGTTSGLMLSCSPLCPPLSESLAVFPPPKERQQYRSEQPKYKRDVIKE